MRPRTRKGYQYKEPSRICILKEVPSWTLREALTMIFGLLLCIAGPVLSMDLVRVLPSISPRIAVVAIIIGLVTMVVTEYYRRLRTNQL